MAEKKVMKRPEYLEKRLRQSFTEKLNEIKARGGETKGNYAYKIGNTWFQSEKLYEEHRRKEAKEYFRNLGKKKND